MQDSIGQKLVELSGRIGCSAHGGTLCLLPNRDAIPIMREYGLPLDHLRLTDAESRARAASLVGPLSEFRLLLTYL